MDTRDKPLEPACHTDPISFVAAPTDDAQDVEHVPPYTEDAVFKGAAGPLHQASMNKNNAFWVLK